MNPLKYLITIVCFLWFLPLARATHIVGGEMNYTCLGNNQYEITLTIFRDCFYGDPNAWFDNPASIGIFDVNNLYLGQILLPLLNNDTLSPVLSGQCFVAPPNVCVHTTTYRDTIELLPRAGGYQLAYQRCCRNQTILNIINPLASGATYGVTITEKALLECNSNPKFKTWPPIYICVNEPIDFDQSAVDVDGDSIVYKLCEPWLGASQQIPRPQPPGAPPYLPVNWVSPPYGVENMLNGLPGGAPLRIDAQTGFLTGVPNTIGQFVVGICVEEYRNGELISTTRRDFQYNVGVCGRPTAGFFVPELECGNLTVQFTNRSENSSDLLWQFNNQDISTELNPTYTFPDTGVHTIRLIVEPNTVCADTFEQEIRLLPLSLKPDFTLNYTSCNDSITFDVINQTTDALSNPMKWNWLLLPSGDTSHAQHPEFTIDESGAYALRLSVEAENGCKSALEKEFNVALLEADLPDTLIVCRGDSVALNPNFNPNYDYEWFPEDGLNNKLSPNPVVLIDSSILYRVVISDTAEFCRIERSVLVKVAENIDNLTITASQDTIFGRGTVQLSATYNTHFKYNWQPDQTLNFSDIFNPLASPTATTTYEVSVQNEAGCEAVASRTIVVVNLACEEPYIFIPSAFSPNNDGVNDVFRVRGNHVDQVYLAVYNRWGQRVFESTAREQGWDGTFRGEALPPDVYGYYAEIRCFGGGIFVKKGNCTLIR
ncbi:MAG: gliding motility-associated C-terminal domain-containing protein [Saprospiraceae bacterium]